ncbi:MAG: lipoprotein insertase outer membrane protein LolB [Burkholderiaceae bacterium]
MRRASLWPALVVALTLGGCATQPPLPPTESNTWHQGRLLVEVKQSPSQRHQLQYLMQGSAQVGRLVLLAPTGNAVAQAQWQPTQALLQQGATQRQFATPQAMVQTLMPTPLPWQAMLDWLQGRATPAPGWQVQSRGSGIEARRDTPPPAVQVQVWVDRP